MDMKVAKIALIAGHYIADYNTASEAGHVVLRSINGVF
jgi:hypothetical protein